MMRPEWCNATVVMYGTIVPGCPSMTRTMTGTVTLNNNLNKIVQAITKCTFYIIIKY